MKRKNSEKNSGVNNAATYMIDVFDNGILVETINSYLFRKSNIYPINAYLKL